MKRNNRNTCFRLFLAPKTIVILLFISIFLVGCSKDDNNMEPLELGLDAPGFTLQSLDGTDVSLSDFNNKVVVLFFFGNNCPSCKAVAPEIESMLVTANASNPDLIVLGLDQWDGNTAKVQGFKAVTNVSFPLLLNASNVATEYATTYDRLVVINKSGKIAFSGNQLASSDLEAVKTEVSELLAK